MKTMKVAVMHSFTPPWKWMEENNGLRIEHFGYNKWKANNAAFEGSEWDLVIFTSEPPEDLLNWVNIHIGPRFKGALHLYRQTGLTT